ncbi:HD domain-containing protein [Muricauda sp. JGD-17]|uniref:HD domain-containing protein n=1 Tax=Flagellimonas ochracea TaxID=2696472 RepID=A0A964WWW2_9FLAO|nr:HD domain-containing protein [Allomuricauda ochracea]NAY91496.1 HD domain-containing protein [Allomuricauda ochracea]
MEDTNLIKRTISFVKETLKNAEGGHDWFHIERVFRTARIISKEEKVDATVVELAALLHDIADPKFHNGDEEIGPETAQNFMESEEIDKDVVVHVVSIIKQMSFKNSLETKTNTFSSKELQVVQDADRLDALGAIGIARAFNYGGYKNRPLYNPDVPPKFNMSKEEYKNTKGPTINHFYEKLLLLKDKMNTETGKKLAIKRHEFMLTFLEQFKNEWESLEPID